MKGLLNRLILIIVSGILLSTSICAALALFSYVSEERGRSINLLEKELELSAAYFNEAFSDAEGFVKTLSSYFLDRCPAVAELNNADGQAYMDSCQSLAESLVSYNDTVCAVYFRLNPELAGPVAGFFLSATADSRAVTEQPPTDLSLYAPDDLEHVAWYYLPVEAGHAIWTDEYFNRNNGISIISYTMPLYLEDGTLLGVVGIDLSMADVHARLREMHLHDRGVAAIMNSDGDIFSPIGTIQLPPADVQKILSSDAISLSYAEGQYDMSLIGCRLQNGDHLLLIIQNEDLFIRENKIILTIVIITFAICATAVWLLTGILFRIIRRFRTDDLTQFETRSAYMDEVTAIDRCIHSRQATRLNIIIFDLNVLKITNDTLGHDRGDQLLADAAGCIRRHFPNLTVYRIGGDEFVICTMQYGENALACQLERFQEEMRQNAKGYTVESGAVIFSSGMATYDPQADRCYDDVFHRADQAMYKEKSAFHRAYPHLDVRRDQDAAS